MRYTTIADTRIPILGLGTWMIGLDATKRDAEIATFRAALDNHNVNLIDTAEMYGEGRSEALVGQYLSTANREDYYIISKILPDNAIAGLYEERCRRSLQLLGIDTLDLYLLHWPSTVPLQPMVHAMEHLVELGLIRHWGVSNFDVHEMEALFRCEGGDHCCVNQVLYNLSNRGIEYDLIPWCREHGVQIMAYSPLGDDTAGRHLMTHTEAVKTLAVKYAVAPEAILLAFVIRDGIINTVFKTASIEHLDANMQALDVTLTPDDLLLLDKTFPAPTAKVPLQKI